MQIHTEAPDHGLKILFKESDAHEDPDEYEGEKETAEEGERDSSTVEELRKILKEKASIPQIQRYLRKCMYILCCLFLPIKLLAPAEPVIIAGEAAEAVFACTFRRRMLQWGKEMSEDCDARLNAALAKLPSGERDRILWSLRCAGWMDECK